MGGCMTLPTGRNRARCISIGLAVLALLTASRVAQRASRRISLPRPRPFGCSRAARDRRGRPRSRGRRVPGPRRCDRARRERGRGAGAAGGQRRRPDRSHGDAGACQHPRASRLGAIHELGSENFTARTWSTICTATPITAWARSSPRAATSRRSPSRSGRRSGWARSGAPATWCRPASGSPAADRTPGSRTTPDGGGCTG